MIRDPHVLGVKFSREGFMEGVVGIDLVEFAFDHLSPLVAPVLAIKL